MTHKRRFHRLLKQRIYRKFLRRKHIAQTGNIRYNKEKYTSNPIRFINILQRHSREHAWCKCMLVTAVAASLLLWVLPQTVAASSFDPTLLVNTESFQIIDEGDSSTDIEIRFGDTVNEKVYWNLTNAEFRFSDDIRADGNITGSGTLTVSGNVKTKADLTINSDSGAADAVLTFGSDTADQTFKFLNAEDRFEFDDDTNVVGNLTASGNVIASGFGKVKGDLTLNSDSGAADAVLTFGSDTADQTLKFLNNEDRFEFDDDTNVVGNLTASGNVIASGFGKVKGDLTLNSDSGAADAVLTFGSDTADQTLKFLNNEDRFEFDDDVNATGGITASGAMVIGGNTRLKGTLDVSGSMSGASMTISSLRSCDTIDTDTAGVLSCGNDADSGSSRGSGSINLMPQYANAVYVSSGAATVGSLGLRYDSGSAVNFYRWQSTKTSNQQYWIVSRVRIPERFSGWETAKPIEFRYRASGAWLEVRALDTDNNNISLTGHTSLKATTWTTATITGPEVSGTFASGSYMTIMVKMVTSGALVPDRAYADASFINLNIDTK